MTHPVRSNTGFTCSVNDGDLLSAQDNLRHQTQFTLQPQSFASCLMTSWCRCINEKHDGDMLYLSSVSLQRVQQWFPASPPTCRLLTWRSRWILSLHPQPLTWSPAGGSSPIILPWVKLTIAAGLAAGWWMWSQVENRAFGPPGLEEVRPTPLSPSQINAVLAIRWTWVEGL